MATKTFTQLVQLQTMIQPMIQKALMSTARIMVKKLRECVDEQYYNDSGFSPNIYKRTYQLLDAAAYQMLGKTAAEIFMDTDYMHYYTGFDPDVILDWAGESKHGADYYQTETTDFWTTFQQWADENVPRILKEELIKQGLKIV